MKKILGLLSLIFLSVVCFAQSDEIQIGKNEIEIGKLFSNNSSIKGNQYSFPDRIHRYFLDTISSIISVQLRGVSRNGKWLDNTGDLIIYDLKSNRVKWTKSINYQSGGILQFHNCIIQHIPGKSFCLSIDNGEKLWKVKNSIYYVDKINRVGLGYSFSNFSGEFSNTLCGINLLNGEEIWNREISKDFGWNDIFHVNDSTLIISASGLHLVNIKNGKGWDYNSITGQNDYTGTIAANAAGIALGILTGTFITTTGHNTVRDLVSNIEADSLHYYFASKEKLASINLNGTINWEVNLPTDTMSKSMIMLQDSLLFLINKGFAFMGERQLNFGTPFFAAYSIKTGKLIYRVALNKKESITGIQLHKQNIDLVVKNKISRYAISNGLAISAKEFDIEKFGGLRYFVGSQVYIQLADSSFCSISKSDTTASFIYTDKGSILKLDSEFNIKNEMNSGDFFVYFLKKDGYRFITKNGTTLILDKSYKSIAQLNCTSNSTLIGNKLYDVQEKSFTEIDLNWVLSKE